jgi:hypothetical protein
MRRLVFSVIVASGLLVAGSSPVLADDPAPTVSVKATAGKKICKVTDPTLDELSGLVATKTGFIGIDDSSLQTNHKKVFFLNDKCKITKTLAYSGKGPLDTEDMVLSPDGATIWIADTGDDGVRSATPTHRPNVALWTMKADGSTEPVIHRLSYPDGDYHDAEALLLQGNSTPLIITKELGKPASIYEPASALKTKNATGVPMKKVGEITVSATTTPSNTVAEIGNKTIDGAAIAPGGDKVALRTYTDALEWDVTSGDVLSALKQKPRTTGLPNEPFGESITYSPDGKYFYTVSDMNGDHTTANYILQYTPATTVTAAKKVSSDSALSGTHWYSNLTINQITLMVGGVGLIGLILVGVGVLGIVRSRKRAGATPAAGYGGLDDASGDPETELIGVGGVPQRAGVYGAGSGGIPPAGGGNGGGSGAVYGAGGGQGGGGPQRGGGPAYGGAGGGGGGGGGPQYARPPGGQQPPQRGGQQPSGGQPGGQPPAPGGPQPPQRGGGQQPPARGGQQPPARGGQQPPARGGQQPPARGGQQPPARGGQQPPARGGQQPPARGGQQPPARGGQQPPARGGQQPPARGDQQPPARGGQPPRGPQPPGRDSNYGGGQQAGPGNGQGRGPAPQGQRPSSGQGMPPGGGGGQGRPQRPQQGPGAGQRPSGGGGYGQGRSPGGDGYAEYAARPEARFDNPGYRR